MYYGSSSHSRRLLLLLAVALLCILPLFFKDELVEKYQDGGWKAYLSESTDSALPAILLPALEPVVFAFMIWSRGSAEEGAQLIKSILLYNSSPTEIHIACDDDSRIYLESRLKLVTHPQHDVHVVFYPITVQDMLDRIEREGSIKTDHEAGTPGLMKLFLHELMPTVNKAIYVDTDALFIADPTILWRVFDTFRPSTAIAMGYHPEQMAHAWHYASRICSCIMLLDFEKLREQRLMDSRLYKDGKAALSPPAFRAMYGEPAGPDGRYDNVKLGDQGFWWAIVDHMPEIFEPLSYDFEVSSCLVETYNTGLVGADDMTEKEELASMMHTEKTPMEGKPVRPKLLHFNCLRAETYMEWDGWNDPTDALNRKWGAAVKYHTGYKWAGSTGPQATRMQERPATVEVSTIPKIEFYDQQQQHRIAGTDETPEH
ncbi:glycosyltransferase family 8 protein [Schizophyllum amplum]|uniref:Glycosyltransferase family 8 protein n=1 Tax=Schizophyllum amplum TaxID=97359 RepID=A0A550C777_9AGAR|nr:glycosyltransferase family 8 protein [Auriculariopsis ampla]